MGKKTSEYINKIQKVLDEIIEPLTTVIGVADNFREQQKEYSDLLDKVQKVDRKYVSGNNEADKRLGAKGTSRSSWPMIRKKKTRRQDGHLPRSTRIADGLARRSSHRFEQANPSLTSSSSDSINSSTTKNRPGSVARNRCPRRALHSQREEASRSAREVMIKLPKV